MGSRKFNPKHEVFCQLYAGYGDRALMANGTLCYMEAFGIVAPTHKIQIKKKGEAKYWGYHPKYNTARNEAFKLITKPDIKARIHSLFKTLFSADAVDSELLKVILQDEDPKAKVLAIREFNELKGRITKKLKLSGALKSNLSPERLAAIAAQVLKDAKIKK